MFINYAHRGSSETMPENTLSAFYLGLYQNANGIETDVSKTKDGVLVLFHDETLDRATDAKGKVSDYTYDQLLSFNVLSKAGPSVRKDKILKLDHFLRYFANQDLTLAIELKVGNVESEVLHLVKKYNAEGKTIITSFEAKYLIKTRGLNQDIPIGYLVRDISENTIAQLKDMKATEICPKAALITKENVDKFHSMGLRVRAWGVKDRVLMKQVYHYGVDGMTVNFPDALSDLINS